MSPDEAMVLKGDVGRPGGRDSSKGESVFLSLLFDCIGRLFLCRDGGPSKVSPAAELTHELG